MATAKTAADKIANAGNEALRDAMEKSMSGLNDLTAHSRKNLEAVIASVTATAKGAETLGSEAVSFSKAAIERQTAAVQSLSGVRSVQDLIEIQSDLAKTHMEACVTQMSKTTELMSALFRDAYQPFSARMTAAVESLQSGR
ncbi:TIGR01841 family phasin [Phenylobacterium sp.]|jgi:phasin family protein|uniref:phasin family protein n=1 Tax=Phenylobacterium sp. TaxID=1871053 RepID=UPI0025D14983|nr:TIGR01841 family phasin [Phenylobacterium sp.]MCA6286437.1 TIGR01841 family phasin [Phenylobacterium sp.]MCA6289935.1 TIGR01841 family phasin [Phenylobacterium sp.]MCA6309274.1 TIGR01841 family phasin [Phenylobacterium sp.]MCA6322928.1 TIGR01841 family phasin [Phenylobacterium sp.]MCA6336835.1 TIGR01841 family phasin [Phenylobacterium sp.]